MALPDREAARVEELLGAFCRARCGEGVTLAYQVRGNRVALVETRPLFIDPDILNSVNVAQFEFDPGSQIWTLYWYDRKNRRQPYPTGRNRDALERLVAEVGADPTGIFWE
ncbi:DUF3024 domain-containing protein [Geobacter sp. FeAm09]|uniref:DUF3024 domain-containing protein n=1 Tax=Geobacter sp. FeAm09 TaxID=2597769 RepID=UPI0011EC2C99|nr:DUF3024 domain-containing protein [Geobacter sp. FeAm09]QEM67505.1 DUF3024 domain-containing protein [Geobacter sp. FeAm09]